MKEWLHSFLSSEQDCAEWVLSRPCRFTLREKPLYPVKRLRDSWPLYYSTPRLKYEGHMLPAFQVQVLKWIGDSGSDPEQASLRYIHLVVNDLTRENSRSVCGPLRHSKAGAWAEHPSTVKLVGVLQLGVSEWNPKLWHFWGRKAFSRKCQWVTHLHVPLS